MNFLFWNIQRKPLTESLGRLVRRHQVDVVMLAESFLPPLDLCRVLNQSEEMPGMWEYAPSHLPEGGKVHIYTRFPQAYCQEIRGVSRVSVRRLFAPNQEEILLVAAHLRAKRNLRENSQAYGVRIVRREIEAGEQEAGHTRTVLVGDLNMNPFETGMIEADGFHGVMSRAIARREGRTVEGHYRPYFYNPMWRLFGDDREGPPGTYYFERNEAVCYYWNLFDQVLIRPSLMSRWQSDSLAILTTDGEESFLTRRGTPTRGGFSDHLPLFFRLDLSRTLAGERDE